jgi:hypothetical protein
MTTLKEIENEKQVIARTEKSLALEKLNCAERTLDEKLS